MITVAHATGPDSSWLQRAGLPNRLFAIGRNEFELYEADDEFVLSVELPGFDPDDVDLRWNDGVLDVAAERREDDRGEVRTYRRRFRFPKPIDDDAIAAEYSRGILEVRLPVDTEAAAGGERIEVGT